MLVELLPEQIADWWDPVLCTALENSLPPIAKWGDPGRTNNIFSALLRGEMQCWQSFSQGTNEEGPWYKIHGFAFTTSVFDACSGTKNLLIYAVCSVDPNSRMLDQKWIAGLKVLRKYARRKGYNQLIAYTDLDRVRQIAKRLGGVERTFIAFDVEER